MKGDAVPAVTQRSILLFFMPLAAQWLMMGLEGPFLAAVIARLADPTTNLAAYGVAFAFALLTESPVIMLLSASTALVEDAASYRRLRNFTNMLNAGCTVAVLLFLLPPVFDAVMRVLNLPADVAQVTWGALALLLPWPGAIGYRRFLQGLLIRAGRTRLVAYGTVLRLFSMAGSALLAVWLFDLPGAWVGALSLSAGVCMEAGIARIMAHGTVRELQRAPRVTARRPARAAVELAAEGGASAEEVAGATFMSRATDAITKTTAVGTLSYREIARFYFPLALTSLISLTVQPLLTFFMGQAALPVQSLAVFPVVHSLSFLFRGPAVSLQEAAIALIGPRFEHARELVRFTTSLALATSGALALLAFTPLADVWFITVSGLSPELAGIALTPTRIGVVLPGLTALLSLQQAVLVQGRVTRPITVATAIEVAGIAVLFLLFGAQLGMVGATAAMLALVGGRLAANGYLVRPVAVVRSASAK